MNWHIGQRIVAVKDHKGKRFLTGDKFTIEGIKKCPMCGELTFDIGIKADCEYQRCAITRQSFKADMFFYYRASYFDPLDDLSNHTADSLMEEMDLKIKQEEHERISI